MRTTWFKLLLPRLAMVLLASSMAPAISAADWVYHVRPNDDIWDLSHRYLKPDVPWQKLQAYNNIADPQHLPPGTSLRIPIPWLRVQPANAQVVAVIGGAHVQLPGQAQPVSLAPGMTLGYGARLSTGDNASLTLQFADGSRVLMQEDSELELDKMSAYGSTGMVDTRMRLQHGHLSNAVTPMTGGAAHFSVETPSATSTVRGTHFRVAADTGQSQTEVLTGGVDVAGDDAHVMVQKGFGVAVADGSQPGQPQPLLAAPVLHCPPHPVNLSPYTLAWETLGGAKNYRVQMAPNDRFEALLLDRVISSSQSDLPDVPSGDYAVRVRGIDSHRLEGEDGVCQLHIEQLAPFAGENLYYALPPENQLVSTQVQGDLHMQTFLPKRESADHWTEMMRVQIFHGMRQVDENQYWNNMKQKWAATCKGSSAAPPVSGEENGYRYAFWIMTCPIDSSTDKPEVALFKIIQGNDSFYVLQKTFKFKPTKEQADLWINNLKASIVCDKRLQDHPCPSVKKSALDEIRM